MPCGGSARKRESPREEVMALERSSASCACACLASASCCRAARRQWRCRNQVAVPPATTPRIATTMMTVNSGMVTLIDGSRVLNGSNDTVTKCRLATAKTTNSRPSGITIRAVKNLRMKLSCCAADPTCSRARVGSSRFAVQPFAHFLAGLEKRHALLIDRHMGAGARVAPRARRAMLHRKRAETAQLDAVAARKGCYDFIEDRVHNILHIPLIEVRVVLGDALNQFGFDHRTWDPWRGASISVK